MSWFQGGIIGLGDVMVDSIHERNVQTHIQREIHYCEIGQGSIQNPAPGIDIISPEGLLCVRQLTHSMLKMPDRVESKSKNRLNTGRIGTSLHMIESLFGLGGSKRCIL